MFTYSELLRSLADRPAAPCQEFKSGQAVQRRITHEVLALAEQAGARLLALGLAPGERVGLAVRDAAEFLPLMHGCLLFGLVAVPLYPPPLFGKTDTYVATLKAILARAEVRALIVDQGLGALLEPLAAKNELRDGPLAGLGIFERQALPEPTHATRGPPRAEDLAFLQFTSGSTETPRGVRVTHANLMANMNSIMRDGLRADANDRGVSWLPLYHDMGLIGFGLAPLLTCTPVTFLSTSSFVKNPAVWLQTLSEQRATITFAPNFAYDLVTRRVDPAGLDLGSVRMWGCGAEPVSCNTLRDFERRFASSGVRAGGVAPCYGLAAR